MTGPAPLPPRRGSLERFLRLFSDVRPGEGPTTLILMLNVFLLLTAYYLIKPVREALILTGGGAEVKSYAAAGQAILLVGLVPAYGWLADRLPRRRLLNAVTAFFVACLVGFWALTRAEVAVGVPFFLWAGIFNLMVVAQFWSFANDLFSKDQGERLFPIVAFGASAGAVGGSALTARLLALTGLPQLLLVAAGLLVLAAGLTALADARERRRQEGALPVHLSSAALPAASGEYQLTSSASARREPASLPGATTGQGAFRLVLADRYLLLVALLMLLLNWVNTNGEYLLGRTVAAAAHAAVAGGTAGGLDAKAWIGRFYSEFYIGVNILGLVMQLLLVSRLIRHAGVRRAILVLPLLAACGYALLGFVPVLSLVRAVKTAENATDYSLQNTLRAVLFLPTTREQKYKAKQVIDAFFVRAGDVLSAVLVGLTHARLTPMAFARVNLGLALAWLILAVLVGRLYAEKSQ